MTDLYLVWHYSHFTSARSLERVYLTEREARWYGGLLALNSGEMDQVVVERVGAGENCDESVVVADLWGNLAVAGGEG